MLKYHNEYLTKEKHNSNVFFPNRSDFLVLDIINLITEMT